MSDAAFSHYKVIVKNAATQAVLRTVTPLLEKRFTYEHEWNVADHGGAAARSFILELYRVDELGNESLPETITVNNPAPAAPSSLNLAEGLNTVLVQPTVPAGRDVAGMQVWVGTSSGFTPGPSNLRYDGPNNETSIPVAATGTYYVRVAFYDTFGKTGLSVSSEESISIVVGTTDPIDIDPPDAPTGLTVTAAFSTVLVEWTNPTDTDLSHTEVWVSETNDLPSAILKSTPITPSEATAISGLPNNTTLYVWARAIDVAENASSFTGPVSVTTRRLIADEIGDAIINADKLAANAVIAGKIAANAVGESHLQNLAVTAAKVASNAITVDKIASGAVSIAKFASGLTPVEIVSSLPSSGNFTGRTVILTTNGKLYRYASGAWTTAVSATDISGQVQAVQIAALEASKITGTLTNSQIADLAAAKLTGQITGTQITDGAISTGKLAAGSVTTAKLVANAITANEIASNAVTAAKITAGAVTTAKLAAAAVEAGNIAAGAIIAGKIAANAVVAGNIAADAVTAGTIAAGAVTASEIAAGAITTEKLVVQGKRDAINADPAIEDESHWRARRSFSGPNDPATNLSVVQVSDGTIGRNVLRATNYVWTYGIGNVRYPINPSETYEVEVVARRIGTTGTMYGVFVFFDAAGNQISASGATGWDGTNSNNHYFPSGKSPSPAWTEYRETMGAQGTMSIPANAVEFEIGLILNYNTGTSTYEVAQFRVARAVDSRLIVDGAVTAQQIAANTITATQIAAGTITAAQIAANTITATQIAAGTITASQIASNTLTATQIAANAITASELASNSVIAAKISAGAVETAKLAAGSVIADKIAAGAVIADKIASNAITTTKLAAGAVTADKIEAAAITAVKIAAGAITGDKVDVDTAINVGSGALISGTSYYDRAALLGEGANSNPVRIHAGHYSPLESPFQVDREGNVIARRLTIYTPDGSSVWFDTVSGFSELARSQLIALNSTRVQTLTTSTATNTETLSFALVETKTITGRVSINKTGLAVSQTWAYGAAEPADAFPSTLTLVIKTRPSGGSWTTRVTKNLTKITSGTPTSSQFKVQKTLYPPEQEFEPGFGYITWPGFKTEAVTEPASLIAEFAASFTGDANGEVYEIVAELTPSTSPLNFHLKTRTLEVVAPGKDFVLDLTAVQGEGNADTLDGYNSSDFWRKSEFSPSNYLPLTGGTLSGTLTFTDTSRYLFNFAGASSWGLHWDTGTNVLAFRGGGNNRLAVDLDSGHVSAASFGGNGSSLTALNASNLSSGTVADARIPTLAISKISGLQSTIDGIPTLNTVVGALANAAGNMNDYTAQSQVHSVNATANGPAGNGYYNVVNVRHRGGATDGTNYGGQLAWGMNSNTNTIAFRSNTGAGTWNAWKTLWHSANFDPSNYLPLAGGSITGPTTVANQSTTIAGVNWNNGWFRIGTSGAGWSFDSNEMYNSGAAVIGTMSGDITLVPDTNLLVNASGFTWNGNTVATQTWANGQFAAASHSHSYLPLTGGTLTGILTVNAGVLIDNAGSGAPHRLVSFNDGSTGTLIITRSQSSWDDSFRLMGGLAQIYANGAAATWNGTTFVAANFSGNGSSLTALNGSNITSGLIPKARLREVNLFDARDDAIVDPNPAQYPDRTHRVDFRLDGSPTSSWRSVLTVRGWVGSYASHQLSFNATNGVSVDHGDLYHRTGRDSTWQSWRKVWDDGNHGAGSGLDADKLDGVQGSEYARVTGATFTGTIYRDSTSSTFNPPGAPGVDAATNVALAFESGNRIVGVNAGYIRTLLGWSNGADIEIGQGGTSLIGGINLLPGSFGLAKVNGQEIATKVWAGNASNLTSGTIADARLTGSYTGLTNVTGSGTATFTGFVNTSSDPYVKTNSNSKYTVISGGTGWTTTSGVMVVRGVSAVSNSGGVDLWAATSGTRQFQLNNFTAQLIDGAQIATQTWAGNASNLTSGTIADARISGSYTGLTNLTGSGTVDFAKFLGNASDTAGAPSYSWTGDTNTGIYRPGSDQVGVAAGGAVQAIYKTTGTRFYNTAAVGADPLSYAGMYSVFSNTKAYNGDIFAVFGSASRTDSTTSWTADRGVTGVYGYASNTARDDGDGYNSTVRGIYGYGRNLGGGRADTLVGAYGYALTDGVDSYTVNSYGGYFQSYEASTGSGNVANMFGIVGDVRLAAGSTNTVGNAYCVEAFINADGGAISTARLYRGRFDLESGSTITTLYGLEFDLVTSQGGTVNNIRPIYIRASAASARSDINGWLRVGGDNGFANATCALQVVGDIQHSGTITGNGSGLTTLNASQLTSGTIADARISGSYTGLTNLTGSGTVDFAKFLGNASDTAGAPSYSWTSDTNTGMYRVTSDAIGFATGGVQRIQIDSAGLSIVNGAITHNAVSSRDKIRVWNSGFYTIGMQSGFTFGSLGDYAMTFQMNNDADRGWWWGHSSHTQAQGAMSLTTGGILYVNSNITSGGNITQLSDRRLKHSIRPWETDFGSMIDRMTPSLFGWNDKGRPQDDFGFIAQDIAEMFPQVIARRTDGMMSVDYAKLSVVAIAALKEERDRVTSLEARLARLEALMEAA